MCSPSLSSLQFVAILLESNILKFRVGGVDLNVFMSNVELRPFEEILFYYSCVWICSDLVML